MTKLNELYKCEICGNIVELAHAGAGELVCCGKPMKLLTENTTDAAVEKHVPVIEKNDDGVKITIGEVPHPMTEEHYIEFIEILTEKGISRKYLMPGDEPVAFFPVKIGIKKARAYCNLHGLWSKE